MTVDQLAAKIARIALISVSRFSEGDSSRYARIGGISVRVSDHRQKLGGGFNEGTGARMGAADVSFEATENLTDDEIYARLRSAWSGEHIHSGNAAQPVANTPKKGGKWKHVAKATTAERASEALAAHIAKGRKTRLVACGSKFQPQVYM